MVRLRWVWQKWRRNGETTVNTLTTYRVATLCGVDSKKVTSFVRAGLVTPLVVNGHLTWTAEDIETLCGLLNFDFRKIKKDVARYPNRDQLEKILSRNERRKKHYPHFMHDRIEAEAEREASGLAEKILALEMELLKLKHLYAQKLDQARMDTELGADSGPPETS